MARHLVFVGGGHAHLTSLKNLDHFMKLGHRATLISPSPYQYYSGMGPGMLSGIYLPQEIRFHVKKLVEDRGGVFIRGKVIGMDASNHLLFLGSGQKVQYDIVSFNTGSEVPMELIGTPPERIYTVKPIERLLEARRKVLERVEESVLNLVVAGGGPAGIEISANLAQLVSNGRGKATITLIAGKWMLQGAPDKVRRLAIESLSRRRIEILEGYHVKKVDPKEVVLSNGRPLIYDMAFIAVGTRPTSLFRDSNLPVGDDGGLLVNPYLQSVSYPEIFGGGDCISFQGQPLKKAGVYAVRQNPILYHNLLAALQGGNLKPFDPGPPYLMIMNMGDGKGIFWKKEWAWDGRIAFLLKDFIDRRFMRKFQVSGELREPSS